VDSALAVGNTNSDLALAVSPSRLHLIDRNGFQSSGLSEGILTRLRADPALNSSGNAMETQSQKLKDQEESRNFLGVVSDIFRIFARKSSKMLGSAWSFAVAAIIIVVWGVTGPAFHFSDTWQLVINTGTTIVTFLMVFLIQNTQNRDSKAMQLKLDEVVRAVQGARNELVNLQELPDEDLTKLEGQFKRVREKAEEKVGNGQCAPQIDPD
jgi:low affinity Fe/Cu permease